MSSDNPTPCDRSDSNPESLANENAANEIRGGTSSDRIWWTILFAVVLALVAGNANAQEAVEQLSVPHAFQLDDAGHSGDAEAVSENAKTSSTTMKASGETVGAIYYGNTIQFDATTPIGASPFSTSSVPGAVYGSAHDFDDRRGGAIAADGSTIIRTTGVLDPFRLSGGLVVSDADKRPESAHLSAQLANFDRDAQPDGWRASVVLLDRTGSPVAMAGHAKFELVVYQSVNGHRQASRLSKQRITWSKPLQFDSHGVAHYTLPLRTSLKPLLGWDDSQYPQSGIRVRPNDRLDWGPSTSLRNHSRTGQLTTSDWRTNIGWPAAAELHVRVSVPTEGTFEAVAPVAIGPRRHYDDVLPW